MAATGVRHTPEQREFIVRRLAAFESPRTICNAFLSHFPGTTCTEQDVSASDPRISIVSPELFILFRTESAATLAAEPLFADQRARLHAMSKLVEDALARGDRAGALTMFKQIAEETGVIGAKASAGKASAAALPPAEQIEEIRCTIVDPVVPVAE